MHLHPSNFNLAFPKLVIKNLLTKKKKKKSITLSVTDNVFPFLYV